MKKKRNSRALWKAKQARKEKEARQTMQRTKTKQKYFAYPMLAVMIIFFIVLLYVLIF
jgi:hypothetical protein